MHIYHTFQRRSEYKVTRALPVRGGRFTAIHDGKKRSVDSLTVSTNHQGDIVPALHLEDAGTYHFEAVGDFRQVNVP